MRRNRKVLGLTQYLRKQEGLDPLPTPKEWPSDYYYNGESGLSFSRLDELLDGNAEGLDFAFSWASTPQGHNHWSDRNDEGYLSTEDTDYIQYLVEEHTQ